jgi:hypothetical protein
LSKQQTVFVGVALSIAGMIATWSLFSHRTTRHRAIEANDPAIERADSEPENRRPMAGDEPRRRSEPPDRWSSPGRSSMHVDIPNVYRTLKATTNLAAEGLNGAGVEAQANAAEPYMIGMIQAMRAIDPAILTDLRDVYADEMCGKTGPTPVQIMTYAKAVIFEARLGSGRGIECALKRGPQEDVVMWTLLDAWDNSGREQLPILATIAASAKDQRTLRRLAPEQDRAQRVAAGTAVPASNLQGAAEELGSRATNTNQ